MKHFDGSQWKRGVGFVSEIVPKPVIAVTANVLYNEHYSTARMNHHIKEENNKLLVEYNWKQKNKSWNSLQIEADTILQDIEANSEASFILEHYFGYNQLNKNTTVEYAVEHPGWQIYPVTNFALNADIENLYGSSFVPYIQGVQPHSVFLARGSEVIVRKPVKIKRSALQKG